MRSDIPVRALDAPLAWPPLRPRMAAADLSSDLRMGVIVNNRLLNENVFSNPPWGSTKVESQGGGVNR